MLPGGAFRPGDGPQHSFQGVPVGTKHVLLWWLADLGLFRYRIRRRLYRKVAAAWIQPDGRLPDEPCYIQIGTAPAVRIVSPSGDYEELS